jgi:membrane protein DedA with SNARE-associated domain
MEASWVKDIVGADAPFDVLVYVSLFLGTFLHEGTAIASGALLLATNQSSPVLTAFALTCGIICGDLAIYGLGRLARSSRWLQQKLSIAERLQPTPWFGDRLIPAVAMCRMIPGVIFPTYLSFGWCGVPFHRFALTTIGVTGLWVPLLLTVFVQFGLQLPSLAQHWPLLLGTVLLIAATMLAARHVWLRLRAETTEPVGAACPIPAH